MHYMTAITRAAMQGKTAERDMTDKRGLVTRKKNRANNTKPARTRDGQSFPGGRPLRRALKSLSIRQNNFTDNVKGHQGTKPGSMRG